MYRIGRPSRKPQLSVTYYVTARRSISSIRSLSGLRAAFIRAWRRQDRRPRCALRLTLRLNLAYQHRRSDRAHWNAARFRPAYAVEYVLLVPGRQNAVQRGLGRAYDADPAH